MKLSFALAGLNIAHLSGIVSAIPTQPHHDVSNASYAADMFTTAIEWSDAYWDEDAGYLLASSSGPGRYDTRHSAWYATQLLARNEQGDVARAIRIFDNVIAGQYLDPSKQWYGDYQQAPSQPEPGTPKYPDEGPYSSWDPNVRDFVGCAWLVALNDYEHLLPVTTVSKIERSLHIAAKGDLYRVGGVDGDNLYPCYSNPWIMRTILQNWVGTRLNDKNLTQAGEHFAQELYDLWNVHHTLSEFNSPTYAGVAMWALALWGQYSSEGSLLKKYTPEILAASWNELAQLYNANLKNTAGPWDRTYGYDMNSYASLTAAVIWGAVGREHAPFPRQISGMYHQEDFAFYPLFALSMPEMLKYLSPESKSSLIKFPGDHFYTAKAYSPPFDTYPRNITTWMSKDLTIGAESIAEAIVGGPAKSSSAFSPALIQWAIDDKQVGCVTHWVTESSIDAVASKNGLHISYPNATMENGPVSFNFLFSGLGINHGANVTGLEGLPGLDLKVKTNALSNYSIVYNTDQEVNEFIFYNITYSMPESFDEAPFISLQVV
ncbi:hypothetical protein N7481_006092 [Penicillium waksmanii]|uniref:uncharacterized protein n=1 Tax=Penicillium waksmanii TaxID=69791 RepID=UPI002546A73F|nr:uncharacterized protein N7481_006092 [Penicillium waksmanii]KAJ5983993.1 hypothetical protein N7481_006092 [Penicillium waksmanii]